MYESLGSHFLRTTTGIQSGADALDKSRVVMTFLTILGVTGILCRFILVIEEETGKELSDSSRSEFLEKILGNNFALSDILVAVFILFCKFLDQAENWIILSHHHEDFNSAQTQE